MYVCGITAYDYSHIGHARSSVFFDTVRRYLEYIGHKVIYVQNFTDVDDKIVRRAESESKTQKEVSEKFIREYLKDMAELNVKNALHPTVSENIDSIIEAIKKLIEKGNAYQVDGDVYFHVPSFEKYGELSGMDIEELNRHRVEPDPRKKDIKDFALWKAAKDEDYRAKAVFESPWGEGRPGWHIECSVLAMKYLGIPFDIHGGGKDLIFPHHENERAQTFALTGIEPVRYWMHNDFVMVEGEKMSKSLGNIVRIRDVLDEYSGEILRYFLISSHYRSALNYSQKMMKNAEKSYISLLNTLELIDMEMAARRVFDDEKNEIRISVDDYVKEYENAMEDDFNVPRALSVLHDMARNINKALNEGKGTLEELECIFSGFLKLCNILGIFTGYERTPVPDREILELIRMREEARRSRDFEKADSIRNKVEEKGFILIDTPRGTRWKRK
jgi:cysteinyl-tRNA synthetase